MRVGNGTEEYDIPDENVAAAMKDGFKPYVMVVKGDEHYQIHPNNIEKAKKDGFEPVDQTTANVINARNPDAKYGMDSSYIPGSLGLLSGTVVGPELLAAKFPGLLSAAKLAAPLSSTGGLVSGEGGGLLSSIKSAAPAALKAAAPYIGGAVGGSAGYGLAHAIRGFLGR